MVSNVTRGGSRRFDFSQSSRSTSAPMLILLVIVWKIRRFSRLDGSGNSILRSKRPGRSKAGSCGTTLASA